MELYRVLHLCGIFMLFSGLVGLWGTYVNGGQPGKSQRVALSVIHGVGMMFILVSGFGMAARMGLFSDLPGWLYLKILIWLLLGASMVLAKRKAQWGTGLVLLWIGLGTLAAYTAIVKF